MDAKQRGKIKPTPLASAFSAIIGVVILYTASASFSDPQKDQKTRPAVMVFKSIWFGGLIFIIIYHYVRATGADVSVGHEIELEEIKTNEPRKPNSAQQLRELDALHRDNLRSGYKVLHRRAEG